MGKRGEGWVLLQFLLFAIIAFAPSVTCFACPDWLRYVGLALLAIGGILGTGGVLALGKNLTAFPRPLEGGALVTSGVYGIVRHPIYSGLIFGTLGWSIFRANLVGIILSIALFLFFDLKSRREEVWLTEAYPGYPEYRQRVKKLIPFIY
jgi:protein-S-isoprenylcysteine O-methyltransferase Ste14